MQRDQSDQLYEPIVLAEHSAHLHLRVSGFQGLVSEFRVQGVGLRVQGLGLRVQGLNSLSLTPSRLPRFSANGQNFKTFSRRERNGKDPSRTTTKEMTVLKKFWLFDWYGNTFIDFQK
jgi:hypothetical protein